ncbi:aspartate carbamoyltransferase [Halieaceae bacterium IMCC14734]|uniref:Aspartate carbamoyltransferase n=1 Tax=Candidatus Litorirhabdus singularis TaxID=2518993 RepID=A0ABT3TEK6_9GAMM|nr:DmsC/YnfH family molybdoenzyme membrane anchor subunit [Candidatus Litorirhabdus singularis]MCX2980743.1 aspartate carbamoyltransferase [Candidatus Litorirhabdus singularis]
MSVEIFEAITSQRSSESIFPLRDNEPEYGKLNDPTSDERNRYGKLIALTDLVDQAESLNINGVTEKGFNPNRNKQHAFHFTADNCIGCHACESACAEKNDTPAHLSFRSVGYVEGGTYPNYTRMNISMACNHCDDPVCLKGCPTNAYTKHEAYGAVIQDPDICFGCGYCTWVCPYNAPQLDPEAGQVEKCNMCVDRLEVGLKPACVSACLGNALDFGVVENTPDNREQINTSIPGFPDPAISHPNIRFQQTKSMPREMSRTDSAPIKYRRDDATGNYKPTLDSKSGSARQWNLARLSSRENPLVLFTLASQAAIGTFVISWLGWFGASSLAPIGQMGTYQSLVLVSLFLIGGGLGMSALHLGKPVRFYRGFNNLRYSPMAREGACAALFMAFAGLHWLASVAQLPVLNEMLPAIAHVQGLASVTASVTGAAALLAAAGTLYYMYRCYRIKARPFWDHWQSGSAFVGATAQLGAAVCGTFALLTGSADAPLLSTLAAIMLCGTVVEAIGLIAHARSMTLSASEGAVSHYAQTTTFGKTWLLRNCSLGLLLCLLAVFIVQPAAWLWVGAVALSLGAALISRALFYVLVVPTTMPGAFFWKNKGFEEHARDIGLANLPQTGVSPRGH